MSILEMTHRQLLSSCGLFSSSQHGMSKYCSILLWKLLQLLWPLLPFDTRQHAEIQFHIKSIRQL